VHKHIESMKGRCYNRVTEGFFPVMSGFPARTNLVGTRKTATGEDCHKEDYLVRIIE